jgi:hypothetical protein
MPTLEQLWLALYVIIDLQRRGRLQFDLRVGDLPLIEFIDAALARRRRDRTEVAGEGLIEIIRAMRNELLELFGRRYQPTLDLALTIEAAAFRRAGAGGIAEALVRTRRVLLASIEDSLPVRRSAQVSDDVSFARLTIRESLEIKPIKQPRKPPPRQRYANAVLLDKRTQRRLEASVSLEPEQRVVLRLDIGQLAHSHVIGPVAFPEQRVQRDIDLDVMVSSSDFDVTDGRADGNVAHGKFFLPGDGGPASSPSNTRFLRFPLRAPREAGQAFCRISYYYRNALLQSQQLVASIGKAGGFRIQTDFTQSENLTHLDVIPDRPRVSVLTNANGAGVHQIVLRRQSDAANTAADGHTFQIKDDVIRKTVANLRRELEERSPVAMRRTPRQLEDDLRVAARHGWDLYVQGPAKRTHELQPVFDDPAGYVIQVVRPTTSAFVFPWAFIYEIPLLTDRPAVCKLISQWDGKQSLIDGLPRQCPHGPHVENVLCPFGFWGFRYCIEQLASSDQPVLTLPVDDSRDFVMAQAEYGIDPDVLTTHVANLRSTLAGTYPKAQLVEGKTKDNIRKLLGQDLTLAYFYCHGERPNSASPDTYLGVGKRETLSAGEFIGWVVAWQHLKMKIWNQVRPLIFINACHSLAIYPETLTSYVDAFVGTAHAAGVIGTEIKVEAGIAADVAERFFSELLKGRNVETALRQIRFDYLAQGNIFGLAYTPYCWADLRIDKPPAAQLS